MIIEFGGYGKGGKLPLNHQPSQVNIKQNPCELSKDQNSRRTGTLDVQSMFESEKIHNTCHQMNLRQDNIIGRSGIRQRGTGQFTVDVSLYQPSREESCVQYSDRIMLIFKSDPYYINLMHVHPTTSYTTEEQVEKFYDQSRKILQITKDHQLIIIPMEHNLNHLETLE